MELYWIRHGMTKGNAEERYIGGRTDEGLAEAGREGLRERKALGLYPAADIVYVSPMKRCLETADIIYPDAEKRIVEGFRECDFGLLENKNEEELRDLPFYRAWIDAGEGAPFPGGESPDAFGRRCERALRELAEKGGLRERTAFVVHGGTIMAVLSRLDEGQRGFYGYYTKNGEGYRCRMTAEDGRMRLFDCEPLREMGAEA